MKIRIDASNKEQYINTLTEGLKRFLNYCNDYPHDTTYTQLKYLAEIMLKDYNKISLNILQFCLPIEYINDTIYPAKMLEVLYQLFRYAIHDGELLSLKDQQSKAKHYVHFDFSVKRPKTLDQI